MINSTKPLSKGYNFVWPNITIAQSKNSTIFNRKIKEMEREKEKEYTRIYLGRSLIGTAMGTSVLNSNSN